MLINAETVIDAFKTSTRYNKHFIKLNTLRKRLQRELGITQGECKMITPCIYANMKCLGWAYDKEREGFIR